MNNVVTDIEGNTYHTLKIGVQEWMVENLKTSRYRNGDPIATTHPLDKNIGHEERPVYQWACGGKECNVEKYGRLYTGFAVVDYRKIAPLGWRVATDDDWNNLELYLMENGFDFKDSDYNVKSIKKKINFPSCLIGVDKDDEYWLNFEAINGRYSNYNHYIAKSLAAQTDWELNRGRDFGTIGINLNLNNKSGFTALPCGSGSKNGFINMGYSASWWSPRWDDFNSRYMTRRQLTYDYISHLKIDYVPASEGYSVRCIKEED